MVSTSVCFLAIRREHNTGPSNSGAVTVGTVPVHRARHQTACAPSQNSAESCRVHLEKNCRWGSHRSRNRGRFFL